MDLPVFFSVAAKERLSVMLGTDGIGDEVRPVLPNVWAVNIEPERALDEYCAMVLRSKTLASLLFDNQIARAFFRAVPGMPEWTMLGKAWWDTTETWPDGSLKYDVVILDAPATGHLDMLRVPKVILNVAKSGLLRRDAERAYRFFQDTHECAVVLVTFEEMPATETLELARALEGELSILVSRLVVNCMLPPLFSMEERRALEAMEQISDDSPVGAVLLSSRNRATRERIQAGGNDLFVVVAHQGHAGAEKKLWTWTGATPAGLADAERPRFRNLDECRAVDAGAGF